MARITVVAGASEIIGRTTLVALAGKMRNGGNGNAAIPELSDDKFTMKSCGAGAGKINDGLSCHPAAAVTAGMLKDKSAATRTGSLFAKPGPVWGLVEPFR